MNLEGKALDVYEVLTGLSDSQMVSVHNEYCYKNSYYDDVINYMSCFDEYAYGMKPTDIVKRYADLDTDKEYFVESIYDIYSFDYYSEAPTNYYNQIAEYCVDNDEDFGVDEIRECLDEED